VDSMLYYVCFGVYQLLQVALELLRWSVIFCRLAYFLQRRNWRALSYELIACAMVVRDLITGAATTWIQRRERVRRRSNLQNNFCVESSPFLNFPLRGGGVECMIGKASVETVSDSSEEDVGMQCSNDVDANARYLTRDFLRSDKHERFIFDRDVALADDALLLPLVLQHFSAFTTNGNGACALHSILGVPTMGAAGWELKAVNARVRARELLGPSFSDLCCSSVARGY
jgi:hypothetical protein